MAADEDGQWPSGAFLEYLASRGFARWDELREHSRNIGAVTISP